jgi:hypothetical protein
VELIAAAYCRVLVWWTWRRERVNSKVLAMNPKISGVNPEFLGFNPEI